MISANAATRETAAPPAQRLLLAINDHPCLDGLDEAAVARDWALETCANPFRALVHLIKGKFAAVLLDEKHLRHEGEELLAEIRRAAPDVCVVATSVGSELPGVDRVVTLPCDAVQLIGEVRDAIQKREELARSEDLNTRVRRLQEEVDLQSRQLRRVREAWRQISGAVADVNELYDVLARVFMELGDVGRFSLMLVDPEKRDEMRIAKAMGLDPKIVESARVKLGEGVSGQAAQKGAPMVAVEANAARGPAGPYVSLPLQVGERTIGAINLTERREPREFAPEELGLLSFLAGQAAAALDQAFALKHAEEQAVTDELTGLYNRRFLMQTLAREIERARRDSRGLAVAMLDIDRFKQYNDSYGHQAGDEMLRHFSELLRKNVRAIDIVCRYGGEEFAVIYPESVAEGKSNGPRDGSLSLDRLRRVVAATQFKKAGNGGGRITFSAGVAAYSRDGEAPEILIAAADERLLAAKSKGRNQIVSPPK